MNSHQKLIVQQRAEARAAMLSQKGGAIDPAAPLCINCTWYQAGYEFTYGKFQHRCTEPMLRDPVTGWATDAALNRKSGIGCGPNGAFYKAKPPAPEPEPKIEDNSKPMEYMPPAPFKRLPYRPPYKDDYDTL